MVEWATTGSKKMKGIIVSRRCDYDTAEAVMFIFPTVKAGFQIPDDVTEEEMVEALERTAKSLREGKSAIHVPARYAEERRKEIRQMQEEEELEAIAQGQTVKGTKA